MTQRPTDEQAREQIAARKAEAANRPRIDNSSLRAGAPMTYYCRICSLVADVLPEDHNSRPRPHCDECTKLVAQGWSAKENCFLDYAIVDCGECHGRGHHGRDCYTKRLRTCGSCDDGKVKRRIAAAVIAGPFDPDKVVC